MNTLTKLISTALHRLADDIEEGVYTCSDEEMGAVLEDLAKFSSERPMSKEQACIYLNMGRGTFDTYVRYGWIPRGKKVMGFKELSWTQGDLELASKKISEMLKTKQDKYFEALDNA